MDDGKGDGARIKRRKKHFKEIARHNKRAGITYIGRSWIRCEVIRQSRYLIWDTRPRFPPGAKTSRLSPRFSPRVSNVAMVGIHKFFGGSKPRKKRAASRKKWAQTSPKAPTASEA